MLGGVVLCITGALLCCPSTTLLLWIDHGACPLYSMGPLVQLFVGGRGAPLWAEQTEISASYGDGEAC